MAIPRKNPKFDRPRSGSRPGFNKERPQMYKTICDVCHKPCEVPFLPNGKKPVFCDSCFDKSRETATSDYIRRKDKTVYDAPEEYSVPIKKSFDVAAMAPLPDAKYAELKRELNSVNAKLDKLIDLMSKLSPKKIIKAVEIKDEE